MNPVALIVLAVNFSDGLFDVDQQFTGCGQSGGSDQMRMLSALRDVINELKPAPLHLLEWNTHLTISG
jgi:hypothetical protein